MLKFGTANCSPNATSPLYLSIDLDDQCQETTWELNANSGLTSIKVGLMIVTLMEEEIKLIPQLRIHFTYFPMNVMNLS